MGHHEKFIRPYYIMAGDFTHAGEASIQVKNLLKQLEIPTDVLRRVAVALYEAEMNRVIYSQDGEIKVNIFTNDIQIISKDSGPGITDVDLAVQEGYSTMPDSMCQMGFGAGMRLPNMRRCCDRFHIGTAPHKGTTIQMTMCYRVGYHAENYAFRYAGSG